MVMTTCLEVLAMIQSRAVLVMIRYQGVVEMI